MKWPRTACSRLRRVTIPCKLKRLLDQHLSSGYPVWAPAPPRRGLIWSASGYPSHMSDSATLSSIYPAVPETVSRARQALREFSIEAGASPRQVEAVRLAGSEAVTNAVVHAYVNEPGNVYITAALVCAEIRVSVADDGCGLEPRSDHAGLGLGLGVISQVSDNLTIAPRAGGGTEVRMRFMLHHAGCSRRRGAARIKSRSTEMRRRGPCDRRSLG